jgi:multicomponent Na+:H+ antiporter subunit C
VYEVLRHYNYWLYVLLLALGLYGMMSKTNLMKKLIAMGIFQWAIIYYFISIGAKRGGNIPIFPEHGIENLTIRAQDYVNPLPHVLMLTAIVVGVATTGIALALLIKIWQNWNTLEEDEILQRMRNE